MKVKEKAQQDLSEALIKFSRGSISDEHRNYVIAGYMQEKGWNVYLHNLLEVAKDLGFPVIGTTIYELDD